MHLETLFTVFLKLFFCSIFFQFFFAVFLLAFVNNFF